MVHGGGDCSALCAWWVNVLVCVAAIGWRQMVAALLWFLALPSYVFV